MATTLVYIIVPPYFDRRRGLATSIMFGAGCMGQFICPPITRLLQDHYGFRGATLIQGAILLHSCIGACFYHPVEWHLKKSHKQLENSSTEEKEVLKIAPKNGELNCKSGTKKTPSRVVLLDKRKSNNNSRFLFNCNSLMRIVHSTISDLGVLRSPRTCIIALGTALCISGYYNFLMMVPFTVQEDGHSLDVAAWCLSTYSITNLVVRIMVPALSDFSWFNMRLCYIAGYAIISVSMLSKYSVSILVAKLILASKIFDT